jgi:hypothetical protein
MTNREKLLNTNIYDLLVSLNIMMLARNHNKTCIIDFLEQKYCNCIDHCCEECIQKYLNKEV